MIKLRGKIIRQYKLNSELIEVFQIIT